MKVWAVFKEYSDYDENVYTYLDTIWSNQDKARERIKSLCSQWIKNHKIDFCDGCLHPCASGHACSYDSIEAPTLDEIIIHESDSEHTAFYVVEKALDESPIEEG